MNKKFLVRCARIRNASFHVLVIKKWIFMWYVFIEVLENTFVSKGAEKIALHACAQSGMQTIAPRWRNQAKCSYRPTLYCRRLTTRSHAIRLFPPIWAQNVVCTSSDMVLMCLVWIPPLLRSSGYPSQSSQSPPCRPWYTIYYYMLLWRLLLFNTDFFLKQCRCTSLWTLDFFQHQFVNNGCTSFWT